MLKKKVVKNPTTGKKYVIHKRSEVNSKAGTIRGMWKKRGKQ